MAPAYPASASRLSAREAGFDHHLGKPADLAALPAVLVTL